MNYDTSVVIFTPHCAVTGVRSKRGITTLNDFKLWTERRKNETSYFVTQTTVHNLFVFSQTQSEMPRSRRSLFILAYLSAWMLYTHIWALLSTEEKKHSYLWDSNPWQLYYTVGLICCSPQIATFPITTIKPRSWPQRWHFWVQWLEISLTSKELCLPNEVILKPTAGIGHYSGQSFMG